ncbi:signal recognition particle, SRP9/SRP14 subunit [Zychaea mexicana]|uniref:signal recognition particle, SRP9/SRP14 subunit n=1 Tax=Zychaea mexicana TaxID=64656 RepID=UPI0022FEC293|nr:signal recognition particle, SRP9/SRP14 subunit [Zychaea mexicana]KAI9488121.1 signal recognition particle, SRP9/SRP14 subunit [Zychaea mexicana]
MYISNWDEFQKAAEELYAASPETTRYVSGFRHTDGELILKVTDDRTIVKYKTNQASDLRKFTTLNISLMSKMQNKSMEGKDFHNYLITTNFCE